MITPEPNPSPAPRAWLWYLPLLGVLAGLTFWGWRKWTDPLIDFGLQLYLPWQLANGQVLYRDVMYLAGGPLSQYFHAALFKLFGASLSTLIITSLCLLALFIGLLQHLFQRAADRWTALMVGLTTVLGFAFSQTNYNYICPYSYETFHGLVLAVAAIGGLWRWVESRKNAWAFAAGLCSGCVFLTKPDLFLALAFTLAAAVCVRLMQAERTPASSLWSLLAGLITPSVMFLGYYAAVGEMKTGFTAIVAAWLPIFTGSTAQNDYYRWCMGLDKPWQNLAHIVTHTFGFIGVVLFLALCARQFKRNAVVAAGLGLLLLGLLYLAFTRFDWTNCGWVFGPVTLLGGILLAGRWWPRRKSPDGAAWVFPLLWSVFALFLLAKMGVATRVWHYGFYLAMPAATFIVFLLLWVLPAELERWEVNRKMFRLLAGTLVMVGLLQLTLTYQFALGRKSLPVGTGNDLMFTEGPQLRPEGIAVKFAIAWIEANTAPTNTLAVLPEGAALNYLTRRVNPTPYLFFALPEVLQAYGENNVLASFEKKRPDYIALVHRDATEFGVAFFGLKPGYGYDIMQWIKANYTPALLLGDEPLKEKGHFGIQILVRNDLRPTPGKAQP